MPDKEPIRELEELSFSKYIIFKRCECCNGKGYVEITSVKDKPPNKYDCDFCGGRKYVKPDKNIRYFVLRIDGEHDPYARNAIHYYALRVWVRNKELSEQIIDWLKKTAKPFKLF